MKDERPRTPQSTDDSTAAKPVKAPYASPVLRVYGSVSAMTQAFPGVGGGDGGPMMTMAPSDRLLKQNIVRLGTHPLGIGLYLFDYRTQYKHRFGHERRLGVMADEVEAILPAAVATHPEGFKMVDYAMLASPSRA